MSLAWVEDRNAVRCLLRFEIAMFLRAAHRSEGPMGSRTLVYCYYCNESYDDPHCRIEILA